MKSRRLRIGGMTCVNCQNKIENKLRNTAGVKSATVSYSAGTADVAYDTDILTHSDISAVIEKLGYKVLPDERRSSPEFGRVVGTLSIIVSLYVLLEQFGVLNLLVPSRLADAGTGYGMLFVIGLLTSVHCVAMCGGINLSQCLPRQTGEADTDRRFVFMPALLYNTGRVLSYTAVGFALGLAGFLFGGGEGAGLSATVQGILKLAAGLFMVLMGLNMLGIFPGLRRFQPRMPRFLAEKAHSERAGGKGPLYVGLLNGLMPCGPLQSMQIVALASGNPLTGAFSMLLFSLGTVPLMLGLGSFVSALGRKFADRVMGVGAVLVVVLGLAMLSQGGSLSGLATPELLLKIIVGLSIVGAVFSFPYKKPVFKTASTAAACVAAVAAVALWNTAGALGGDGSDVGVVNAAAGVQVVESQLASGSYPNITVQVGIPVKWVIEAPENSINGCNYKMNIAAYGIAGYEFVPGENTIEFTPNKTGTFSYSCWMGMIRGTITVTQGPGGTADAPAGAQETGLPVPSGYQIPTDTVAIAEETVYEGYPVQEVTISLTDEGFSPAVVLVKSGVDVVWHIDNALSGTDSGTQLLVPGYATRLTLAGGDNPLFFTPAGDFDFSTGDSAFYGYVKVVDDLAADLDEVKAEVSRFETLIWPPETFFDQGAAGGAASGEAVAAAVEDGVQYVTSAVSSRGYEPIEVQKGIPVKWTLQASAGSLNGCNNAIVIPEYDLQVDLKAGDNLIEFTPDRSGTFVFSCWMGMVRSSIVVTSEDGTVDAAGDDGSDSLPSCCG
ncbi:MAG TPA: sulfite exporter TauE/SafE family protein [Terriglobales bacterium]|nr:sulfite exporter TauE/SafE family protein [Terriglobales bacterium]